MGFSRRYNGIIRSIDNIRKIYKLSKKKDKSKKEDKNENSILK